MTTLVSWLQQNKDLVTAVAAGVTALAALAAVAVSLVYARITRRLWHATLAEAEATAAQADAAREQAEITRRIFEAAHRPYVTVRVEGPQGTPAPDRLSVSLLLANAGTVPATITGWRVRAVLVSPAGVEEPVTPTAPVGTPVGRSLAPQESVTVRLHFVGPGLPDPAHPFRLRARVEYKGVGGGYRTDLDAERVGRDWTRQGYALP